ncbi:hypothetical protein Tco_1553955 [Tanacetum coccineum]
MIRSTLGDVLIVELWRLILLGANPIPHRLLLCFVYCTMVVTRGARVFKCVCLHGCLVLAHIPQQVVTQSKAAKVGQRLRTLLVSLSWRQTKDYLVIIRLRSRSLWRLRSEAIEGCDQKPLDTAITKLADVKKMLEAVVKVLVAGIRDVVLETISVYCLDPKDLKVLSRSQRRTWLDYYSHGLNRETLYRVIIYSGSGMILVMEWSVMNLTEGVDWEAERLNAIIKRLSGRLCKRLSERLCKRFSGKLFRRFENWYMFGTKGKFEASESFRTSGSSVDRLSIFVTDLVTSRKVKVKRWMFKGEKAFSHVNFDEYICVALSEGLLIVGKEDLTCVETLGSLERLRCGSLGASPSEPGVVSIYLIKD